jgi:hypothetical protein
MAGGRVDLTKAVQAAVRHFWQTRARQSKAQGAKSGDWDRGARSAVTGGAHLDGFADLIRKLVVDSGVCDASVHRRSRVELPGYYRAEKKWDIVVVVAGHLLATIEFKAQVGPSFGNNYNNRTEEALGNATDFWAAYREGAFRESAKPWLGYLMLLEDAPESARPVSVVEPHFPVFDEFREASYARRYEVLLTKMMRDRLYDAASLLLTRSSAVRSGAYSEPCAELALANFAESLVARAIAYSRTHT